MTGKIGIIALSILVGVSTVGCGQAKEEVRSDETQVTDVIKQQEIVPEEGATLTLMVDYEIYGEKIAEGFRSKYPNVNINVMTGDNKTVDEKVRLDGPRGEGPDVFIIAHDRMTDCVEYGMVLPIEERLVDELEDELLEVALKTAQVEGVTYGLPITAEAMAIYYNKDIVGDTPATTFEEIFELAQTFNNRDDNQYAFLMNVGDAYNAYAMLSAYGFNLFGEDGLDIDHPGMDSEAFEKGLGFLEKLKGIMPLTTDELYNEFIDEQFIKGNVAYVYDGPWKLDTYKSSGMNFGVATIPSVAGNTLTPFGGIINAHVSAYTKYPKAAMLLAYYMASEEGANILYQTRQKVPVLKTLSGIEGIESDEATQMFAKQFEVAKPMPSNKRINYYWDIVPGSIKSIFNEGKSAKEVQDLTWEKWQQAVSNEYFGS